LKGFKLLATNCEDKNKLSLLGLSHGQKSKTIENLTTDQISSLKKDYGHVEVHFIVRMEDLSSDETNLTLAPWYFLWIIMTKIQSVVKQVFIMTKTSFEGASYC
jgi:hypothetical protein